MSLGTNNAGEGLQGRRLKEAVKYVSRTWMPVNSHVLALVRDRLSKGYYKDPNTSIVADIKTDFALLAYCLRKLGAVISSEQAKLNPIDVMRQLEIEQLQAIFATCEADISSHRLEDMKEVQALRVRHSLVSCSTAEILARRNSLNPDFAFSCAALRQLGFQLIAWNYPSSFQQAVGGIASSGNDIEVELARILGFEPAMLGYEVALNWSESNELRLALGRGIRENAAKERAESFREKVQISAVEQAAGRVARFCELGEILAKVNNQSHYPKAVQEWQDVQQELAHLMGETGTEAITELVKELSAPYVAVKSDVFSKDLSPEITVKKVQAEYVARLLEENTYVRRCPEVMQQDFKEVYSHISQGAVSTEGLSKLVGKLIPRAGFIRGCIFVVDQATAQLVPKVRIGDANSRQFRPISCSAAGEKSNPISEAFHCVTPIKQENAFLLNDVISHVSGKFGNTDKGGVLFLELSEELLSKDNHTPTLYFKAIRCCLDHCLNLIPQKTV
jgi:hypothetical protein